MIWVDWVILAIIGVSALISLLRGFVREALSLAGWIAAFFLAKFFYVPLSELLVDHIETNSIRLGVSWAAIFVATLVLAGIINYMVGKMVDAAGMSGMDRLLGMFFGALRGVLIVALIVLGLKQFTPVPKDKWWGQSSLIPHMGMVAAWFYEKLGEVVPELKDNEQSEEKTVEPLIDPESDAIGALIKMNALDQRDIPENEDDSSETHSSTEKDEQN
ncbi:CvpA family protein [Kangiella sediminilitoris]|uniref:Bacteriocin production protein n=1 Tax=Kangiella sediminilitoris TaxID=1144748 RepID=A0A1B3BAA0_9GAMM|nr:CvpA family protein [Kangiella sediminilitoris]AOE49732.1 bacteriocin production protein [Kangiella sediminilitoris]